MPTATPANIAVDSGAGEAPANALTSAGWGPLRIGMTRAEVVAAVGDKADPSLVSGADVAACDEFHPVAAPEDMLVMLERNRLTRIALTRSAALQTARGFAIGTPASAVKTAYGDAARVEGHKYEPAPAEYITVWDVGGQSGAYTDNPDARGIRYVVSSSGNVASIYAGGPSIQYVEGCA